jgi:hypothetical protein
MDLKRIADRYIKKTSNREETIFENGDTEDIISVILRADGMAAHFTEQFAPYLRGQTTKETAENVWNFVKAHIRYRKDRVGHERVKSPGKLWEDGEGDCKSYSVFMGSIYRNLGLAYKYRFAHYPSGRLDRDVNHVFPVVIDERGREIPTDAVADYFNYEEPYEYAIDYDPETGRQAINGVAGFQIPTWVKYAFAIMLGIGICQWANNND